MKVAVVGSRSFRSYSIVKEVLDHLEQEKNKDISLIISGGAVGADTLGARYAKERNIPTQIFLPLWDVYGKSAGYKRNVQIVSAAEIVVAFWDGSSRGTLHSINLAREQGKELILIREGIHGDVTGIR